MLAQRKLQLASSKSGGRSDDAHCLPDNGSWMRPRLLAGVDSVRERPTEYSTDASAPLPAPRVTTRVSTRAIAAMRLRHFSPRTERAYLGWMRRYYEFHGRRDPVKLGAEHVTAFLNALATRFRVAGSTISSTPRRPCACPWCSRATRCAPCSRG